MMLQPDTGSPVAPEARLLINLQGRFDRKTCQPSYDSPIQGTLPAAGMLSLDGRAVAQNDFLPVTPVPGIVWTPRESNRAWQAMAVSADGMTLAALGFENFGAYIYISTDGGISWAARGTLSGWSDIACSADGSKMIASDYLADCTSPRIPA